MPNGNSIEELKKLYKKRGFNVHTLSEFVNIPAELEKARKAELRSLGVTPLNNGTPSPTRKNNKNKNKKRQIQPYEKRSLEMQARAALNINNNIPPEFQNLGGRNRSSTATSDPRSTSPASQGGRRTRKHKHKRKSRKYTRKH